VAALFHLANWWLHTGHHALLLEHTCTLSLEEHFCIVWPLLLTLLVVRSRLRRTVGELGIVTLLVVLLLPWPESIDAVRGSCPRGTPIVWGCLLALALHALASAARPVCSRVWRRCPRWWSCSWSSWSRTGCRRCG